jgi:nitrogen-specific signal transduction histidine kinase
MLLVAGLCLTPLFLDSVYLPQPQSGQVPEAIYGPGFPVFVLYFFLAAILICLRFTIDLLRASGIQRAEFQFILLGFLVATLLGSTAALIIPMLSETTRTSQFGPLSTIAMNLIIAYGIARYRIMDVPQLFRRVTAYVLAVVAFMAFFGIVMLVSRMALSSLPLKQPDHWAALLAALLLSMGALPRQGLLHRFASRLLTNLQSVDSNRSLRKSMRLLRGVYTVPELLRRFTVLIIEAMDADHGAVLLRDGDSFVQRFPQEPEDFPVLQLTEDDPLIQKLQRTQRPLVLDSLPRLRPTSERRQVMHKLMELKASIVVAIRSRDRIEGFIMLGARKSGRIYGEQEQTMLQMYCDQMAVALENARLYTEAQDRKIYNEILLDSLPSGVIACNAEGKITVLNSEANRIIRRPLKVEDHPPISDLPEPLAAIIHQGLQLGQDVRDLEVTLHHPDEDLFLRVGSARFQDHRGRLMGVLLVISDQSLIHKLEVQVRRTDRLASVGTLSAGMAHEIKNPLVSIKTFSQLLPERYEDPDFRETFSSLLNQEVTRIDSIVNQLLHFARPSKPQLAPVSMRTILDDSLMLVDQQLQQRNIKLQREYLAEKDLVHADTDLLHQAFLNFFLNAIEAMADGGRLTVRIETAKPAWQQAPPWRASRHPCIRVSISDTGRGIKMENIPSIFDPFFTTKADGSGLGLSVAHGVIQEHGGSIDVTSRPESGTTFRIDFPMLDESTPVVTSQESVF